MEAQGMSVLVVGGSLVGLSAAVFLAWRGVPPVLVERYPGSSPHPRAIGFTPRTMELFRAVGLGLHIPQVPPGTRRRPRRVRVESLTGEWFEETPWTPEEREVPEIEYSPCRGAAIAQDRLEPILRERAVELSADLRLETELIRFEQDADGVAARARRGRIRPARRLPGRGGRSPQPGARGVGDRPRWTRPPPDGPQRPVPRPARGVPADGDQAVLADQPGFDAFLTTYSDGRWVLFFSDDEERDEEALRASVCRAIGRSGLPVERPAKPRSNADDPLIHAMGPMLRADLFASLPAVTEHLGSRASALPGGASACRPCRSSPSSPRGSRSKPISTTGPSFTVRLDPVGAMEVRLIA